MRKPPLAATSRPSERCSTPAPPTRTRADRDGTPPLHWIAHRGELELAERLLAAGADVNAANRYGVTPLHLAIEQSDVALTRRLLDAGADAARPDAGGRDTADARRARGAKQR